jgi:beta propeller repeat protein
MKRRGMVESRGLLIPCTLCLVVAIIIFPVMVSGDEPAPVPVPDFTANVTSGAAPLVVQFTDHSTGSPETWNWSFGDGTFSEAKDPLHTYADPGTYTPGLTVSMDDQPGETLLRPDYLVVTALPPETPTPETETPAMVSETPTPELTTPEPAPVPVIQALDPASMPSGSSGFILHVSGTGFTEYSKVQWNGVEKSTTFIPGTGIEAEISPSDVALPSGSTISVRVFDDGRGGLSDAVDFLITPEVPTPEPTGTTPQPAETIQELTEITPEPTETTPELTETTPKPTETTPSLMLMTAETPVANFTASPTWYSAPALIQFTDLSTGTIVQWNWSFGDGTFSEEQNPVHEYGNAGSYSVTLTVYTGEGASDVFTRPEDIEVCNFNWGSPHLDVWFNFEPDMGYAPLPVQFTGYSSEADLWHWVFDDGTFSEEENPVHIYQTPGYYHPHVIAENLSSMECTGWGGEYSVSVTQNPALLPLKADFDAFQNQGPAPLEVHFSDSSSGVPVRWNWSFGDGAFSGEQNPVHTYWLAGRYTVTLTVEDGTTSSTVSRPAVGVTSENYCLVRTWGSGGEGDPGVGDAAGIAVDDYDDLYVADMADYRIKKYDTRGHFLTAWGSQDFWGRYDFMPEAVAVDASGDVYVADPLHDGIKKFTPHGQYLGTFPMYGDVSPITHWPEGIAFDTQGNYYVTDWQAMVVQKFDSDGRFLGEWGTPGDWGAGEDQFAFPEGIAVDPSDNVYVADSYNRRVLKFDAGMHLLDIWSYETTGDWFNGPSGVATDFAGNVFVTDSSNVKKYAPGGVLLSLWTPENGASGIAVDPTGFVYVGGSSSVQKFGPCGIQEPDPNAEPEFPTSGGNFTRISTGTGLKSQPAINGDRIVWTDSGNGNDIYLYDIPTGTGRQVTTDPSAQNTARISGDKVVWVDGRKGAWHVYLADLTAGTETAIGTGEVELFPDISGDRVVWVDTRKGKNSLYLYDIPTGYERQIATTAVSPHQPAISGNRVAFTDVRDGNTDIYVYDIATGTETRITTDPGTQVFPDIDGDLVVWSDARGGGYSDTYLHNLATRTETRISPGPGNDLFPRISGNLIAWQWVLQGGGDRIVMYDLRNRTSIQITPGAGKNGPPDISGNRVTWVKAGDGNYTLMLFTWNGNPVKYLVADLFANRRTIPALEPLFFNDTSSGVPPISWNWDFGDGTTSILQHPVHTYQTPGTYTVRLRVSAGSGLKDAVEKTDYIQVIEPLTEVPVTDFSADPVQGTEPLSVVFTDHSPGYPSSWLWDFGDGTTSAQGGGVTHLYSSPGTYSVSLTASNHVGSNRTVKDGYITVKPIYIPPTPIPVPVPHIRGLNPASMAAASPEFTLFISGSNFNRQSRVQWNGKELTTLVVSDSEIRVNISPSNLAKTGSIPVKILTYNGGGYSNSMDFYVTAAIPTTTPAPAPTPQPGALTLAVTPKQHQVQPFQTLQYDIDVFQDGRLVPADIEVKLDGKGIASFRASHYTYELPAPSIDEHYLEITARDADLRAGPDPWRQKILTLGSITPALLRADAMHTAADNEIYSAEEITERRGIEFSYSLLKDVSQAGVAKILNILSSTFISDASASVFRDNLNLQKWITAYFGFVGEKHLKDYVISTLVRSIGMTYLNINEYLDTPEGSHWVYNAIMHSRDADITYYYENVDTTSGAFKNHIQNYPDSYLNSEALMTLFTIYTQRIQNVVETEPVFFQVTTGGPQPVLQQIPYILSLKQTADQYDLASRFKSEFTITRLIFLVERDLAFRDGLANDVALDNVDSIVTFVNPLMKMIEDLAFGAIGGQILYFNLMKGFWYLSLTFSVLPDAYLTDFAHSNGIHQIEQARVPGASADGPLMVSARDTLVLSAADISSTGDSLIISPDGRVVDIIAGEGSFIPPSPGTYGVIAYQHAGALFSDVAETSFDATLPKVTLEETHTIREDSAVVTSTVCNRDSLTVDNLSVLVTAETREGFPVFFQETDFSLQEGGCREDTFTVDLPASGVYIGRVELTRHLFSSIGEKAFVMRIGEDIPEGVAILGTGIRESYLPSERVILNVTLESYHQESTFTLKMPDFGYSEEVTVHGIQTVQLVLPRLPPDVYTTPIVAEKDGSILDSRTVRITVRAEGVGIVTIMPDEVYYPLHEPVSVRLALKDLLMNPIDAEGRVAVIQPDGSVRDFSSPVGNGQVDFLFTPPSEGTYIIEGTAYKEGWQITGDRTLILVGTMSPLLMDVQKSGDDYIARIYANALPAQCYLTIAGGEGTEKIFVGDGVLSFNRSGSFTLTADRMFYEPSYYSYTAPETLPTAGFSANKTAGTSPLAILFTDQSVGRELTSWTWAFGDSKYAYDQNPVHVYEEPGTYSVTLTVANASGSNYLTKTDSITVAAPVMPVAGFTADQQAGKAPLTVTFTDTSTGEPRSWLWDFGDGATSDEPGPVHEYRTAGTYDVRLTATNGAGSDTKTVAALITVLPKTPPVADFTASPLSGNAPLKVSFTDRSAGTPASWEWTFGDGATSTDRNPSHEYTAPGLYTVSLTAVNPDGTDTKTLQDAISVTAPPTPPVARFSVSPMMGRTPLIARFTDRSTGSPTSWQWTFGDGMTSDVPSPAHTYSGAGIYVARLKVTNGGGSDTAWNLVIVLPRWWPWG